MKTRAKNNQLLLWRSKGAAAEGITTPDELKKSPGYPSLKSLQEGPVAIIECIEEIPCDPCESDLHQAHGLPRADWSSPERSTRVRGCAEARIPHTRLRNCGSW